uniref:DUF4422 domain-containing protein n=1 Tax=Olsenella timonensis TaxID=1805478 RepID=UPI00094EA265|nr:DUF4422 domain-containing protein [Olsenella timonensis]
MPLFSIVIPAYKNERYLAGCLESVLSQSCEDLECVVVVDGSPDASSSVVAEYGAKDQRVRLIDKKENEGTHRARMSGVEASRGDYIYLLDADDELPPDALSSLRDALVVEPDADMLHYGINVVGVDINEAERSSFEEYINRPCDDLNGAEILAAACASDMGYLQDWRVTQRVYSRELLQRAFAAMTRDRLGRAQDGYEYFVIASMARRQVTRNDIVALDYFYGRGINGDAGLSPDAFLKSARDFQATIDAIAAFSEQRQGQIVSAREGAVTKLLELLMNDWHARLSNEDKLAVLDELAGVIGADALSAELMRFVRDDAYALWCTDGVLGEGSQLEAWAAAARSLRDGLGRSERYEAMRDDAERHLASLRLRTERWSTYENQPVRIFVSTHKDVNFFQGDVLQPVQVGASLRSGSIRHALRDDAGENISDLNPMYCELTTQYWAWKNVDAEYYGFCHYRRYFDFSPVRHSENPWGEIIADRICDETQREYRLDDASIREAVEGYDVITTEFKDLRRFPADYSTPHEHYEKAPQLNIDDLDRCMRIVAEMHPDYAEDVEAYLRGNTSCFCNMFIMRKGIFQDYCAWLFPILERFLAESDMSRYSREGMRTPGHLAERLLNIYYNHHMRIGAGWRTKQLQCVHFERPERSYELQEVHSPRYLPVVPVVLAADDNYVPMLTTTIYSMLKNASTSFHYDVVVIGRDIPAERRSVMSRFLSRFPNMTLRFVDPNPIVDAYELKTNNAHIGIETYYRFLIQELLPFYDKVLYLDSDLVVEGDVSELFSSDLGDDLLAAVHDIDFLGNLNLDDGVRMRYSKEVLRLDDPYGYFQAGVLLLNTRALRGLCTVGEWLEAVSNSKFIYDDQDVLNSRCQGRVRYLDYRWNVMNDCRGRVGKLFSIAPASVYDAYLASREDPAIVHYAGADKPWNCVRCDEAARFWAYARETPFYEELVRSLSGVGGDGEKGPVAKALSRAASAGSPLRKAAEPLFPAGSRRRELAKRIVRAARGR